MILAWLCTRRTRQATRPGSFFTTQAGGCGHSACGARGPNQGKRGRVAFGAAQLATKAAVAVASLSATAA